MDPFSMVFDKLVPATSPAVFEQFLDASNKVRQIDTKLPTSTTKEIIFETQDSVELVNEVMYLETQVKSQTAELECFKNISLGQRSRILQRPSIPRSQNPFDLMQLSCDKLEQQRNEIDIWAQRKVLLETVMNQFMGELQQMYLNSVSALQELKARNKALRQAAYDSEALLADKMRRLEQSRRIKWIHEIKIHEALYEYRILAGQFKLEYTRKREREEHQCLHKCGCMVIPLRRDDVKPEVDAMILYMTMTNLKPLCKLMSGEEYVLPEPKQMVKVSGCHCIMHLIEHYPHNLAGLPTPETSTNEPTSNVNSDAESIGVISENAASDDYAYPEVNDDANVEVIPESSEESENELMEKINYLCNKIEKAEMQRLGVDAVAPVENEAQVRDVAEAPEEEVVQVDQNEVLEITADGISIKSSPQDSMIDSHSFSSGSSKSGVELPRSDNSFDSTRSRNSL